MPTVERPVASGKSRRGSASKANGKARANGAGQVDVIASPAKGTYVLQD